MFIVYKDYGLPAVFLLDAVDLGAKGGDVYFGYGKVNPYGALLQTP